MIAWLQALFNTPARQALGWTALGILGFAFAISGVWLMTGDDGGTPARASQDETPTATATAPASPSPSPTRTATPSPTASPTPEETETPTATATRRPTGGGQGSAGSSAATATPVPATPTSAPAVSGGPYCNTATDGTISTISRIAGNVTVGGAAAPAGQTVTVRFDGVAGPSTTTIQGNGGTGYAITYAIGSAGCANRPGAAISVVFGGSTYATGFVVPPGNDGNLQLAHISAP